MIFYLIHFLSRAVANLVVRGVYFLDFQLSPCSECCMLSSGNSPASEFYACTIQMLGNYPEESIQRVFISLAVEAYSADEIPL